MNAWMYEKWMNEWMNEWMEEWMNECMNAYEWMSFLSLVRGMNKKFNEEWMSEWMNPKEWINELMNEWFLIGLVSCLPLLQGMNECIWMNDS